MKSFNEKKEKLQGVVSYPPSYLNKNKNHNESSMEYLRLRPKIEYPIKVSRERKITSGGLVYTLIFKKIDSNVAGLRLRPKIEYLIKYMWARYFKTRKIREQDFSNLFVKNMICLERNLQYFLY